MRWRRDKICKLYTKKTLPFDCHDQGQSGHTPIKTKIVDIFFQASSSLHFIHRSGREPPHGDKNHESETFLMMKLETKICPLPHNGWRTIFS